MEDDRQAELAANRCFLKCIKFTCIISTIIILSTGFIDVLEDWSSIKHDINDESIWDQLGLIFLKLITFVLFPLLALFGVALQSLLQTRPIQLATSCVQPVICLIPNILPLGYHTYLSFVLLISQFRVLSNYMEIASNWILFMFYLIRFLATMTSFCLFYTLIQLFYGELQLAKEYYSTSRSRITRPTETNNLLNVD